MKTTNLLNEKLELVTEISTLKMALNEASGMELTGCKVSSVGYLFSVKFEEWRRILV